MKKVLLSFLIVSLAIMTALWIVVPVQADDPPVCTFIPPDTWDCATGGGGDSGGGGGGGEENNECGLTTEFVVFGPAGPGMCAGALWQIDTCTGTRMLSDVFVILPCPEQQPQSENPCDTFTIDNGGVYCNSSKWRVEAQVSFPEVFLDVRPYPASLVRWPTAMRTHLQPNSGSGTLAYYSSSGGSSGSPHEGDLANITLTLTLQPVGKTYVQIPRIGVYETRGGSAYCISVNRIILAGGIPPKKFCWEVPSHPAAGGGPLAGTISGFDELPADMPVFVGSAHAPYHLFWNLSYQQYVRYCPCGSCEGSDVPGINSWKLNGRRWEPFCDTNIPSGATGNCSVSVPAECNYDYKWEPHSQGGEILPSQVQGLPASLAADLDGNGTPDAYWDNNLTLRRMDDYDHVGTSAWGRSWNWGGTIYWGVREGQGQIGWPGVP